MNYTVSRRARADLIDIQDYIARDNPAAAERVVDDILLAFEKLAERPQMGQIRQDLTNRPVRFWSVYSYMIVYQDSEDGIGIARVLSSFRDISTLLD
jgi:plasmid stabilization system protein ParE